MNKVNKMQQINEEMIKLRCEKDKLYEELKTIMEMSNTIIKELIEKVKGR